MRKTFGLCLLVLLLTGSAVAGEMPNLSPAPQSAQPSANGDMQNGIMPNGVADTLTRIALDLLAALF